MLHSTSSGTELLLRSQHRTSPVHNLRKSKITMMVAAGLLVLVVISVALGVALRPRPERQVDFGLQHPAMARLALANFSFDNINASASAAGGGSPAVASGAVGRQEALLGFVLRESNKTAFRRPGDDYDELDKI
ncbi:hypothetical protein MTO96_006694 [Rhipicephalus appendiculatus]|uniref:Uncharacterized protein n=1 Tax=Rhipicephalus appendiculatus TaxID=34631 RepID=A0A131Z6L1_RHIAP